MTPPKPGTEGNLTKSGESPSPLSSRTLFWVGFVFCSPVELGCFTKEKKKKSGSFLWQFPSTDFSLNLWKENDCTIKPWFFIEVTHEVKWFYVLHNLSSDSPNPTNNEFFYNYIGAELNQGFTHTKDKGCHWALPPVHVNSQVYCPALLLPQQLSKACSAELPLLPQDAGLFSCAHLST